MRSIQSSDGQSVQSRSRVLTMFLLALLAATAAVSCVLLGGRQYVLQQYYDQLAFMEREVAHLEAKVARARATIWMWQFRFIVGHFANGK